MTKTLCDFCGKESEDRFGIYVHHYIEKEFLGKPHKQFTADKYDACSDCVEEINRMIKLYKTPLEGVVLYNIPTPVKES